MTATRAPRTRMTAGGKSRCRSGVTGDVDMQLMGVGCERPPGDAAGACVGKAELRHDPRMQVEREAIAAAYEMVDHTVRIGEIRHTARVRLIDDGEVRLALRQMHVGTARTGQITGDARRARQIRHFAYPKPDSAQVRTVAHNPAIAVTRDADVEDVDDL